MQVFRQVGKEGLMEEVTSEQILGGRERMSHKKQERWGGARGGAVEKQPVQ